MTVVEVIVAALILVLGSLAVLSMVDAGARGTYRAEQSQVVNDRLQREMEAIKRLSYDQIALTALPADSSDTTKPAWRVSGSNYAVSQNGGSPEPLVYNGGSLYGGGTVSGGAVAATPTAFSDGDVSGTIYRYVVWEDDLTCSPTLCPGTQDLKRVIVSVRLNTTASGGRRHYQELQSQVVDPDAKPVDNSNPTPPGDDTTKPWTFWLTDTPCSNTARQPITGAHAIHNTRGACAAGLNTGNTPGAPDLLFDEAPPFTDESPLFDYSTDVEPSVNPDQDVGLSMLKLSGTGCPLSTIDLPLVPDVTEPNRFQKVHKWVTPAIPTGFDVTLDGTGTLNLWTKTTNAAVYPGKICVWLFTRQLNGLGDPVDTPVVNLDAPLSGQSYFAYQQDPWPADWTEVHVPIHFSISAHLVEGTRLGLAVAPEGGTTTGSGLEFMYDEPSFDSRLEIATHSALPDF